MSILIKGMEMQENCLDCELCYDAFCCRALGIGFYAARGWRKILRSSPKRPRHRVGSTTRILAMRKIDAMHARFGILPDKRCEDCCHLIKGYVGNTFVRKCTVYGATHSEASDWRKKYVACGLFNKPWNGGKIIRVVQSENAKQRLLDENIPLDGQIEMEGL